MQSSRLAGGVREFHRTAQFLRRYGFAAAATAYAFTVGIRSSRHRNLIAQIARRFGYREGPHPTLPMIAIDALTRDSTAVELRAPEERDGNVSLLELLVLSRLVREQAPRILFEIGTFDGRTALNLAANSPDDALVYTLDLPPGEPTAMDLVPQERKFVRASDTGVRLRGSDCARKVQQLYGDSARFDFTPYTADFVFVDASHAYEYVLSDSRNAVTMLRNGRGTVVWHDYGADWEGVTRALHQLRATDPRFAGMRWIAGTTLVILRR